MKALRSLPLKRWWCATALLCAFPLTVQAGECDLIDELVKKYPRPVGMSIDDDFMKGGEAYSAGDVAKAIPHMTRLAAQGSTLAMRTLADIYHHRKGHENVRAAQCYYTAYLQAEKNEGRNKDVARAAAAGLFCKSPVISPRTLISDPQRGLGLASEMKEKSLLAARAWTQYICYSALPAPDADRAMKYLKEGLSHEGGEGAADPVSKRAIAYLKAEMDIKPGRFRRYDKDGAIKTFESAARAGDARAQYLLSEAYQGGAGAPHDKDKAHHWLKESAKNGHGMAQFALGGVYFYGMGGEDQDHAQALKWFARAADSRNFLGALFASGMYKHGMGVKASEEDARHWLERCRRLAGEKNGASCVEKFWEGFGVAR